MHPTDVPWFPPTAGIPASLHHALDGDRSAGRDLRQHGCFWLVPWLVHESQRWSGLYLQIDPACEAHAWQVVKLGGGRLHRRFETARGAAVYMGLNTFSEGFNAPYWAYDDDAKEVLRAWWMVFAGQPTPEDAVAAFERFDDPSQRADAVADATASRPCGKDERIPLDTVTPHWLAARRADRLGRSPRLDVVDDHLGSGRFIEAWAELEAMVRTKELAGYPPQDAVELASRVARSAGWVDVQEALHLLGGPIKTGSPPELGFRPRYPVQASREMDRLAEDDLLHGSLAEREAVLAWLHTYPMSRANGALVTALKMDETAFRHPKPNGTTVDLRFDILDLALASYAPTNLFLKVRLRIELMNPRYGAHIAERFLALDEVWVRTRKDELIDSNPGLAVFF